LSLVVKAPGFEEGSRVVEMSGGERREERFELKPLPARAVEPVAARDVALAAPVATAGGAGAPADHGPPSLVTSPSSAPPETAAPIYKRWWFWTALGAVAAGTAVLVVTHPWRSNSPCDGAGSPCTVW
jgi:hypothetical protein